MKSLVYTSFVTAALAAMPATAFAAESPIPSAPSNALIDSNIIDSVTKDTAQSSRGGSRGGFRGGSRGGFRGGSRGGFRGGSRGGFRGGSFLGRRGYGGSYIRPYVGFRLPTYWINPTYYIPNYRIYHLSAPTTGYVWSRYYNDAVLLDQQGFVHQTTPNVQWQDGSNAFHQGSQPMPVEGQVYGWNEGANVGGAPTSSQAGTYQGQWTGGYVDAQGQQYQGQWNGTYVDENGETFQGQWNGTTIGAPVQSGGSTQVVPNQTGQITTYPAGAPYPQQQGVPQQSFNQVPQQNFSEEYEQCLRKNGVAGATIGAIVGGVAGNRIAGRNNRTAGTLIGGGVGAVTGLGIDKATDNCKQFLNQPIAQAPQQFPQQQIPQQQFPQQQYPQQIPQQQYPQQQYPQQTVERQDGKYAKCLRKRGITGGVLGALLGGVAGNRIAGRNSRTAGTLIGGGLGAITGATIEKATRKCESKRVHGQQQFAQQQVRYYQPPVQYYWASPGYYYPQTTTTVTVHSQAVQQEEVVYEEVGKRLTKPVKRLKKPQR